MENFRATAIIVAGLFSIVTSTSVKPENCEFKNTNFTNLNLDKFSGIWYTMFLQNHEYAERFKCIWSDFKVKGSSDLLVNTTYFDAEDNATHVNSAVVRVANDLLPADYKKSPNEFDFTGIYYVHMTDYTGYSVLSGCVSNFPTPIVWLAFRSPKPDQKSLTNAKQVVEEMGLHFKDFDRECQYL